MNAVQAQQADLARQISEAQQASAAENTLQEREQVIVLHNAGGVLIVSLRCPSSAEPSIISCRCDVLCLRHGKPREGFSADASMLDTVNIM